MKTIIELWKEGRTRFTNQLSRITTHTAYHAGQLAIVIKYGN